MEPKAKQIRLETNPSSMKIQEDKNNLEDRLSRLHVSVLSRILTKLPTADAVRTCVLSKSWRNIWTNITDLHFNDANVGDIRFIQFVDRLLRNNTSLNSFHLRSVYHLGNSSLIISWLSKLLRCNLQRLVIMCHTVDSVNLSPLLARFGSLVELRLHTNSDLEFSAPAFLQNLKVFSIKYASIVNKSSISNDLVLKFPILETFIVSYCFYCRTSSVILDSPLLKIFEVFKCVSASGVCKIRVSASNLEKVTFSGNDRDMFLLDVPPCLPDAHLSLSILDWSEKFLESFTCVKSLNLEINIFNGFGEIKIPKFRHLINLNLVYDMTQHANFMMFLNSVPILGKLRLHDLAPHHLTPRSETLEKLFSETAPDCIQTTLKVLQIKRFQINKIQIPVLKYVMENAKNLESVTLYTREVIPKEGKAQVLSYPKASPYASVFFK